MVTLFLLCMTKKISTFIQRQVKWAARSLRHQSSLRRFNNKACKKWRARRRSPLFPSLRLNARVALRRRQTPRSQRQDGRGTHGASALCFYKIKDRRETRLRGLTCLYTTALSVSVIALFSVWLCVQVHSTSSAVWSSSFQVAHLPWLGPPASCYLVELSECLLSFCLLISINDWF